METRAELSVVAPEKSSVGVVDDVGDDELEGFFREETDPVFGRIF